MALYIAIGEVTSIVVRRHNAGVIGDAAFAQALTEFRAEVIDATELEVANVPRKAGDELVLVTCDARLLRAAQLEGLLRFNPELDTQTQLDALITG